MNHHIDWVWFVRLANRIRNRSGARGCSSGANFHPAVCAAARSYGYRSSRPDRETPGGDNAMKYAALISGADTWRCYPVRSTGATAAAEAPVIRPSEVADFDLLYRQNCSGCHGTNGQGALTVGIGTSRVPRHRRRCDDPPRHRGGQARNRHAGFAQKAGGMLTDAQIDILVHGIRARWARPGRFRQRQIPPAYAASQPGDAERGHNVFATSCSSCHGPDGRGARAIADSSYLALVSDQHLRTVMIVGMPHLGMPDWRSHAKAAVRCRRDRCRRVARGAAAAAFIGAIESLRRF